MVAVAAAELTHGIRRSVQLIQANGASLTPPVPGRPWPWSQALNLGLGEPAWTRSLYIDANLLLDETVLLGQVLDLLSHRCTRPRHIVTSIHRSLQKRNATLDRDERTSRDTTHRSQVIAFGLSFSSFCVS